MSFKKSFRQSRKRRQSQAYLQKRLSIVEERDREPVCLKGLLELIQDDKELAEFLPFFSERFLLHFVRGRKCKVKETFSTLKNYIKVRKDKFPEIFKHLRPSNSLNVTHFKILKNRDDQGRLVVVSYFKLWDPKLHPTDDLIGECALYLDELMNFEEVEKRGLVQIADMSGFGLKHAKSATPMYMHKLVSIFHSALPIRLKGSHIIHEKYLFTVAAKSLMVLLPKKIQERLHFHSNSMESLHKYISPDILPKSLGGYLPEEEAFMDLSEIQQNIRNRENYYEQIAQKF